MDFILVNENIQRPGKWHDREFPAWHRTGAEAVGQTVVQQQLSVEPVPVDENGRGLSFEGYGYEQGPDAPSVPVEIPSEE